MTTQQPNRLSAHRLTRRGAVGGALGAAALLGVATVDRASGQDATPAAGQETTALRPLLSENPMWEAF
jgi:hypothetical protein